MKLQAIKTDITTCEVDVIVNAANSAMIIGGGVDGAIHRAAGPELIEENMARHGFGCPTGQVKITGAHNLNATLVFHTVGPDMRLYKQAIGDLLLASCYKKCIETLVEVGLTTIAFPAISTGVYGFDSKRAAKIAVDTIALFTEYDITVTFACFSDNDVAIYDAAIPLSTTEIVEGGKSTVKELTGMINDEIKEIA